MNEPKRTSPHERGEVEVQGTCQVCGVDGPIIAVPGAPTPNAFCPPCAIEYGLAVADDDDLGA